jgi:signal peptidase I
VAEISSEFAPTCRAHEDAHEESQNVLPAEQIHSSDSIPQQSRHSEPAGDGLLPAIQSLTLMLVVAIFFTTFCVQPVRIPSASMEPTLLVGDFLLLNKRPILGTASGLLPPDVIHHDDVIVFHDPAEDSTAHLVKRVIGLPGDRIHLRDGVVYRNGVPLSEPFTVHRASPADFYRDDFPDLQTLDLRVTPAWWIALRRLAPDGELTVPPDNYFVLGDNRNDSEDSRYWGFVPRATIVGKPELIYFSLRQPDNPPDVDALRSIPGPFGFARWGRTFHVIH